MRGLKLKVNASENEAPPRDFDITQSGSFTKGDFKINQNWKNMSLNDLETKHLLGKGSSGNVYLVCHKASGQLFALKYISVFDDQKRKTIINELQTLYSASSEHLVGVLLIFHTVCHDNLSCILYSLLIYINGILIVSISHYDFVPILLIGKRLDFLELFIKREIFK